MAYNEKLANAIREHLVKFNNGITEKKMFGGLSFLYQGKMSVGVVGDELAVRIIDSKMQLELEKHNVRPMDFTKRPMKEFVFVTIENYKNLSYWIHLGIEHAKSKLE